MSRVAAFRNGLAALLIGFATSLTAAPPAAYAQSQTLGPSGLPLPRFVSLKSSRVNLRVGPGRNYAVDWLYLKSGIPVEIIQEFDNWRRVRDADGSEGWVNQSLLSGRRTGVVAPWEKDKATLAPMFLNADDKSGLVATLEPGAMGTIKACNGVWCEMTFAGVRGWVSQTLIWGAYPGEQVED